MGTICSINIGPKKGGAKRPVPDARFIADWGIEGDGHGGPGMKQVSLLAWEGALRMRESGADVGYGSFGENITTSCVDLSKLDVGDKIRLGEKVLLKVTKLGKECPEPCAIFRQVGYCIMPDEGVFCSVIEGGPVKLGDEIVVLERSAEGREA